MALSLLAGQLVKGVAAFAAKEETWKKMKKQTEYHEPYGTAIPITQECIPPTPDDTTVSTISFELKIPEDMLGECGQLFIILTWQPFFKLTSLKMMFVSGETVEPSAEVTAMVEQIVQQQVQEMLKQCNELATRRGSRSISTDDLMFLIRHDKPKLARLRHFLQWKDVRKNVKDADDRGGGGGDANVDVPPEGEALAGTAGVPGTGPNVELKKNKKARVDLVWDVPSFFNEQVPPRDDEEDEEEEEMNLATLQRLKYADERTKDMSREDYMHWSECRQASFTFRKGRRFREWAGFGVVTDTKPNDDIIDILGFLTFEIVQTLTEEALKVKQAEDLYKKAFGTDKKEAENGPNNPKKRKREPGLFDWPEEEKDPVQCAHIREGFRRLQRPTNKSRAMFNMTNLMGRRPLRLVRRYEIIKNPLEILMIHSRSNSSGSDEGGSYRKSTGAIPIPGKQEQVLSEYEPKTLEELLEEEPQKGFKVVEEDGKLLIKH
jgi:transcription initiation protein SPT3